MSLSFSAVAAEAGLSRPTLYGHFADRGRLIAALHERSVRRAVVAVESAAPDWGPPVAALRRVVEASWGHLAHHFDIARAVASEIGGESMHAAHHDAMLLLARLIERGRAEGVFRDDLSEVWLVNACLGLIHTAAVAAHTAQMGADAALEAVVTTVVELCVGPTAVVTAQEKTRRPRRTK